MASGDPFPRVGDEVDPVKFPSPTLVALISLVALCRRPWAYVWGSNKFGCTGPRPIGTGSGLTPKTRLFLTWVNMPNLISVGQTVRASYRDTPEKLGVILKFTHYYWAVVRIYYISCVAIGMSNGLGGLATTHGVVFAPKQSMSKPNCQVYVKPSSALKIQCKPRSGISSFHSIHNAVC